jgi:hypothetical protein
MCAAVCPPQCDGAGGLRLPTEDLAIQVEKDVADDHTFFSGSSGMLITFNVSGCCVPESSVVPGEQLGTACLPVSLPALVPPTPPCITPTGHAMHAGPHLHREEPRQQE